MPRARSWSQSNSFLTRLALFGFLLLFLSPLVEARKISKITIRSTDIFDFKTKPYLKKVPYTWINLLHIQTRQDVIKRELLFKVGDEVDPFLLRETERNLRARSYFRAARISTFPQRDKTVHVVVYVGDSWTTEPQLNLAGLNKIDDIEFGFKEKNLFGTGKEIKILYNDSDEENSLTYKYFDQRLFKSRWELTAQTINRTNGTEDKISLIRPFYSADTKYSMGSTYTHDIKPIEQFANNVKVSEFEQDEEVNETFIATKIGGGRKVTSRVGFRYRDEQKRFSRTDKTSAVRPIPVAQDFRTLFLDVNSQANRFLVLRRVEKMQRIEDINLGPSITVSPGFSPEALTTRQDTTQLGVIYEQKHLFKNEHLLINRASYQGRDTFDNASNESYSFESKFYYRPSTLHTLVIRSRVDIGSRLDSDNQITLGGENGLRAFKRDDFVGTRGGVFNIEDRLYIIDELWNLVSIGAVIFYDAGYVWGAGRTVSLSDVRSDIGAGLRMGLTRSSNEVIVRFDVAYRLQRTSSTDKEWVFSFGSGQAF